MNIGPSMWDERFKDAAQPYGTEPSLFLKEQVGRFRPGGRVLVPGDGGGRNGIWLARQGFEVHVVDYSREGVSGALARARAAGVFLRAEQADVTTWNWPVSAYDAVVSVYLHISEAMRTVVHAKILRALKPGGLFLIEGFHRDQMAYASGGPRDPDMLFTEESVRQDVASATILELRRDLVELHESVLHQGTGVLIRLLAKVD